MPCPAAMTVSQWQRFSSCLTLPGNARRERYMYLSRLAFPGNVRQLENLCHWLTVMAAGQGIGPGDLPAEFRDHGATSASEWRASREHMALHGVAGGQPGL